MGRHLSEVASRYSSMAESRNLTDLVDYENNPPPPLVNVDTINDSNLEAILERETVSMATTLCLLTGLWQIILAAVNLGRFRYEISAGPWQATVLLFQLDPFWCGDECLHNWSCHSCFHISIESPFWSEISTTKFVVPQIGLCEFLIEQSSSFAIFHSNPFSDLYRLLQPCVRNKSNHTSYWTSHFFGSGFPWFCLEGTGWTHFLSSVNNCHYSQKCPKCAGFQFQSNWLLWSEGQRFHMCLTSKISIKLMLLDKFLQGMATFVQAKLWHL